MIESENSKATDVRGILRTACMTMARGDPKSVATAAEGAIWGVGSTITTVATLWRTVVDAWTFDIRSFGCTGARRPRRVTVRGGGQGHEWDKNVRYRAGAGRVGMVCSVHGVGRCENGTLGWNAATRAHPRAFMSRAHGAICGRTRI